LREINARRSGRNSYRFATLAAIASLTRARRRDIACWLGLAEFAEASVLQREPEQRATPHTTHAAATKERTKPARQIDPDQPSTWPARFAFAPPRDPLAVPESRAPRIRALRRPHIIKACDRITGGLFIAFGLRLAASRAQKDTVEHVGVSAEKGRSQMAPGLSPLYRYADCTVQEGPEGKAVSR